MAKLLIFHYFYREIFLACITKKNTDIDSNSINLANETFFFRYTILKILICGSSYFTNFVTTDPCVKT
jgi:hypothetical protein